MRLPLIIFFILLTTSLFAQFPPIYEEVNGLVVMETESADGYGQWTLVQSPRLFTGAGSLIFDGSNNFNNPGRSILTYKVNITTTGKYRFQWRSSIARGNSNTDNNDSWLRFPDASAFYATRSGSTVFPRGSGQTPNPEGSGSNGWFKVYQNSLADWSWNANTSDNDPHAIFVEFDTAGVYTLQVSGRSNGHSIDRMVLYHSSVAGDFARNTGRRESPLTGGVSVFEVPESHPLLVYPNPTEEQINVDLPTSITIGSYDLQVWNATGRQVANRRVRVIPGETIAVPTADLPPGAYVLRMMVGEEQYRGRFVKR